MSLGLGNSLSKGGTSGPTIVTDELVLKHNYDAGTVVPLSDGAAYFDGSDDYISTGFVPDYISTNATVAFWVNMVDFSSDQIMGFHNNKRWYHGFSTSDLFIGVANAHNGSSLITPSPALVAGQWFHYCVTAIGGTATVYINGVAQGTMSYAQSSATDPDSGYFIGAKDDSGAGSYMNGYICNVGQWSTGLTQAQIKSIMNKNYGDLSDSEKTNLEAWWNLDSSLTTGAVLTTMSDTPSVVGDAVYDNHDTTYTDISVTNGDFTSGSGTTITGWTNESNQWTRTGDTVVSGTTSKLLSQDVNLADESYKIIVNAKNTVADSTGSMQIYLGANNYLRFNLTNDFEDYVLYGYNDEPTADQNIHIYNESSTNITVNSVTVQRFNGNPGILI